MRTLLNYNKQLRYIDPIFIKIHNNGSNEVLFKKIKEAPSLQILTESIILYKELLHIVTCSRNIYDRQKHLLRMLDCILTGYAYIVGSDDRRVILNWVLDELIINTIEGREVKSVFSKEYLNEL